MGCRGQARSCRAWWQAWVAARIGARANVVGSSWVSSASALRTAAILRDSWGINILKLDVRGHDHRPDTWQTLEAAYELRALGMELMPFIVPDVEVACLLADAGCVAVRVMASPVASGRGIPDQVAIRRIVEECHLPVIVEDGLGSAKHVALAMELGAAATLVNTALVQARDPLKMAAAMRQAAVAGRLAYEAGPMAGDLVGVA